MDYIMKTSITLLILSLSLVACGKKMRGASGLPAGGPSLEQQNPGDGNGGVSNGDTQTPAITPEKSKELVEEFIPQINPAGGDNRFSTALFAIAREMITVKETEKFTDIEIPTGFLKDGPLVVQLHLSADPKAPLAIVMNPLFSGDFQDQMLRFKEYYAKRGYHVIAFPNPWSPEYLKHNPSFFPGDIWTEAKMHLELFDYVIDNKIGRDKIKGVTLVGVSYGAFLGGVVKAYDQKRVRPLIDGPTLLINPPHDMVHSLRTIDRQVSEVSLKDGGKCLLNGGLLGIIKAAMKISDYNQSKINEACAKYFLTTVGFNLAMKYSVSTLNKSKNLGLSAKEIASMTFSKYIEMVAKMKPNDTDSDLGFWLNEARRFGYEKMLVVNSVDDSINEGNDLSANKYFHFSAQNLITLPTGGHTGLREAKTKASCGPEWINCLLKAVYP